MLFLELMYLKGLISKKVKIDSAEVEISVINVHITQTEFSFVFIKYYSQS